MTGANSYFFLIKARGAMDEFAIKARQKIPDLLVGSPPEFGGKSSKASLEVRITELDVVASPLEFRRTALESRPHRFWSACSIPV